MVTASIASNLEPRQRPQKRICDSEPDRTAAGGGERMFVADGPAVVRVSRADVILGRLEAALGLGE